MSEFPFPTVPTTSSVKQPINVLLVDDHSVVRAGFRRLLETSSEITVIGEADTGDKAWRLFQDLGPDVVVMDLSMPGMGGLEAIEKIRKIAAQARILVLSVHENEPFPSRALQKGAAGYLSKRCAPEELVIAVREIADGKCYLGKDIARRLAAERRDSERDLLTKLTSREFQVFTLLAKGRSVAEIADTIFISPKTVHVHRANVFRKLGISTTAELVRMAIRNDIIDLYG